MIAIAERRVRLCGARVHPAQANSIRFQFEGLVKFVAENAIPRVPVEELRREMLRPRDMDIAFTCDDLVQVGRDKPYFDTWGSLERFEMTKLQIARPRLPVDQCQDFTD
jgi:hypothetical protein